MKTIAVANQKGGVGKTTTAVTRVHGLAMALSRVGHTAYDHAGCDRDRC